MPLSRKCERLAQHLVSEEIRAGHAADTEGEAAFRVCEKLRRPLSTLAGVAGFRSLLARALALAQAEVPWLDRLQINPDGSLEVPAEIEAQRERLAAARGGAALIAQLLTLLVTFIGEALTLRLVQDVWPTAAFKESKSGGDES